MNKRKHIERSLLPGHCDYIWYDLHNHSKRFSGATAAIIKNKNSRNGCLEIQVALNEDPDNYAPYVIIHNEQLDRIMKAWAKHRGYGLTPLALDAATPSRLQKSSTAKAKRPAKARGATRRAQ